MKHGLKLAGMIAAIALHFPACADERLDGLKQMNAEGCVKVISLEKDAPQDPKLAKPYCTCVYDTYYDKFTQAEKDHMFLKTPAPPNMQENLQIRLKAAKAECRKKVGS
jgi:hypothetical protein